MLCSSVRGIMQICIFIGIYGFESANSYRFTDLAIAKSIFEALGTKFQDGDHPSRPIKSYSIASVISTG